MGSTTIGDSVVFFVSLMFVTFKSKLDRCLPFFPSKKYLPCAACYREMPVIVIADCLRQPSAPVRHFTTPTAAAVLVAEWSLLTALPRAMKP